MPKLHQGRRYDLWWKNPYKYHQQLKDRGESQVLWDYSFLTKYKINLLEFMRQNFHGMPWKAYVLDRNSCYLIDYTCDKEEHRGSWPVWDYKNYNLKELQDYLQTPWDERPVNPTATWYDTPVKGQKHRVFISGIKNGSADPIARGKRQRLTKIQKAFPNVEMFLKPEDFSFPLMFGSGFTAGCLDPYHWHYLSKGTVIMPNGAFIPLYNEGRIYREGPKFEYLGYSPDDILTVPEIGLEFQIASARYAAHHWDDPTGPFIGARARILNDVDYKNPDMYAKAPSYEVINNFKKDKIKETDKILCDSCSLWRLCPAYRSEEVCGLPNTESRKLSEMAKSRNADDVVEMLASVVGKQAERVERRLDNEQFEPGGHDKEVDKMLNNLFKNGTQLAKLRNPNLGRPLVQINTGNTQNNQIVASADPRALAASVIQEIEATGVNREDITEEMIAEHLGAQRAIEAEIVDAEEV